MNRILVAASLAVASLIGGAANAATISIGTFTTAGFLSASAGSTAETLETFEGYGAGSWNTAAVTNVGMFSSVGGTGSGRVCKPSAVTAACDGLAVQSGTAFGQGNVWPVAGTKSLSSNDTFGIVWNVATRTGALFNSVVFGLRDVADKRGTFFTIAVDGVTLTASGQRNASQQLVTIDFEKDVRSATIRLFSTDVKGTLRANDGFSFDGAAVNLSPSPVPLPASVLLLGAAIGGLGAMRRRRKAA